LLRCSQLVPPQVVDAEVPKGKAAVEPLCLARTRRASLFPLLQREYAAVTDMAASTVQEGALDDVWLAYRGRRVVPGPELRRGRKGLYDVVHHTCVEGLKKNPRFTGACRALSPSRK
jgi:hypothetical protein